MEEDRQEVYVIGGKISHVKLPSKIIEELDVWKKECDKIKNHPLSFLKNHENAGSLGNFYQTSVPYNLVDNSFWLAFTLRCCAQLYGGVHKDYRIFVIKVIQILYMITKAHVQELFIILIKTHLQYSMMTI